MNKELKVGRPERQPTTQSGPESQMESDPYVMGKRADAGSVERQDLQAVAILWRWGVKERWI